MIIQILTKIQNYFIFNHYMNAYKLFFLYIKIKNKLQSIFVYSISKCDIKYEDTVDGGVLNDTILKIQRTLFIYKLRIKNRKYTQHLLNTAIHIYK